MGGRDSLQNPSQFIAASRHGQLESEFGSALRDRFGLPGVLRTLHGPHPEDVSPETRVVATRDTIRYYHSGLRGVEEMVDQKTPGRLVG